MGPGPRLGLAEVMGPPFGVGHVVCSHRVTGGGGAIGPGAADFAGLAVLLHCPKHALPSVGKDHAKHGQANGNTGAEDEGLSAPKAVDGIEDDGKVRYFHGVSSGARGPGEGWGSVDDRGGHSVGVGLAVLAGVVFKGWLAPTDSRDDASLEGIGVDVCVEVDGDADGVHGVSNGAGAPVRWLAQLCFQLLNHGVQNRQGLMVSATAGIKDALAQVVNHGLNPGPFVVGVPVDGLFPPVQAGRGVAHGVSNGARGPGSGWGSGGVVFDELADAFDILEGQQLDRLGSDGSPTQNAPTQAVHLVGDGLSGQGLGDPDGALALDEVVNDERDVHGILQWGAEAPG